MSAGRENVSPPCLYLASFLLFTAKRANIVFIVLRIDTDNYTLKTKMQIKSGLNDSYIWKIVTEMEKRGRFCLQLQKSLKVLQLAPCC